MHLKTLVGGKQRHIHCKIFLLRQMFLVSAKFHEGAKTFAQLRQVLPPSVLRILMDLEQCYLSVIN